MKKLLVSMLVVALCVPAMAATVVDAAGGTGEITLTVTVSEDDVLRGLAVAISQADGDAGDMVLAAGTDVSAPDFNTYIDWAMTNSAGYDIGLGHAAAKIDAAGAIDGRFRHRGPANIHFQRRASNPGRPQNAPGVHDHYRIT